MIEAKMKEQAIFRLYEKYPYLNCKINKIVNTVKPFDWVKKHLDDCACCSNKEKKYKLKIVKEFSS